jgi:hypothetical protein
MSSQAGNRLILISGFVLLAATSFGRADHLFRSCRQPVCPAFSDNCFGFHPTVWRVWPAECSKPVAPITESVPMPTPVTEKSSKPETPPKKDEKKLPEPTPPAKENKSTLDDSVLAPREVPGNAFKPTVVPSVFSTGFQR